ncbi:erythromycin resistance leader peptide [Staphylococcus aureus]
MGTFSIFVINKVRYQPNQNADCKIKLDN